MCLLTSEIGRLCLLSPALVSLTQHWSILLFLENQFSVSLILFFCFLLSLHDSLFSANIQFKLSSFSSFFLNESLGHWLSTFQFFAYKLFNAINFPLALLSHVPQILIYHVFSFIQFKIFSDLPWVFFFDPWLI